MCHALQRRQGSRPGVCRHSSIKVVGGKITFFFFHFCSFAVEQNTTYKVQNGNEVVSAFLGFFFSCFQQTLWPGSVSWREHDTPEAEP